MSSSVAPTRRRPFRALRLARRTLGSPRRAPSRPAEGQPEASADGARAMASAILLAFADLGVHLPSRRERLIARMRAAHDLGSASLAHFLELCLDAHLLIPRPAGCLQLSGAEAMALEKSLDGPSPVPEVQASRWVDRLRSAT